MPCKQEIKPLCYTQYVEITIQKIVCCLFYVKIHRLENNEIYGFYANINFWANRRLIDIKAIGIKIFFQIKIAGDTRSNIFKRFSDTQLFLSADT